VILTHCLQEPIPVYTWCEPFKIAVLGIKIEQGSSKGCFDSFTLHCFRPYWRCYYSNTDAIIYVVDSADRDRIGISKDELLCMLRVSGLSNAVT